MVCLEFEPGAAVGIRTWVYGMEGIELGMVVPFEIGSMTIDRPLIMGNNHLWHLRRRN